MRDNHDQQHHHWQQLLLNAISQPGQLLEAYTAFWQYSFGNQLLAYLQCKARGIALGPLASYQAWKNKGRQVRRGERALELCMPLSLKDKNDPDKIHTAFVFKRNWFVLAQTDGDAIAPDPVPTWDCATALVNLDVQEVRFADLNGNTQGYAQRRTIAINPLAQLPHKTRFHELAHVVLGHTAEGDCSDTEHTPRNLQEVEAESTALILCETLQLEGAAYCRGYIQHWLQTSGQDAIPPASARKIFHAADTILKAGRAMEVPHV
jgi:N-terminal domain of anti-restriction factor ArdC/IrrE N-terminal-like domain